MLRHRTNDYSIVRPAEIRNHFATRPGQWGESHWPYVVRVSWDFTAGNLNFNMTLYTTYKARGCVCMASGHGYEP